LGKSGGSKVVHLIDLTAWTQYYFLEKQRNKTLEQIRIIFGFTRGFDLREDRVVRDAGRSLGENTRNRQLVGQKSSESSEQLASRSNSTDAILMKDMLRDAITVENISSQHKFLANADKGHHQTSA